MRSRCGLAAAIAAIAVIAGAAPALAQATPSEAATGIRDDGVFVEEGSDLSEAEAGQLVAAVRNTGERFSLMVLTEDPVGGAVAFGDAVVDRLAEPGLVLVLAPSDVGYAGFGEVYTVDDLETALDAAAVTGGDDTSYVTGFVEALTGATVADPGATPSTDAPEPASGGSGGFIIFLVIVALLVVGLVWLVRRGKKQVEAADESRVAAARAAIQDQIDAIANDILEMEDEVRLADNTRVDELFAAATTTYQEAADRLGGVAAPPDLLAISNELDTAVWQLDSAEAILDGKEPPPEPEPKRLEPASRPPAPNGGAGSGPLGLPPRPTYPSGGYQRRPTRRSGGWAPGALEILIGLGGLAMARRSRSPARGAAGSGGGFLSSPSRRGSSAGSSATTSARRGTGGRVRGGRRRRR
jgi:hypothetical protein